MALNRFDELFWQSIEELVRQSALVINRPKGSSLPRYPDFIYPVDYGYLAETVSMDRQGIDAWKGTRSESSVDAILRTVDREKRDAEFKLLISCTERGNAVIYNS